MTETRTIIVDMRGDFLSVAFNIKNCFSFGRILLSVVFNRASFAQPKENKVALVSG
jgi:hypothetical protein